MIALFIALACLPIDGSKLLAKHFAAIVPQFATLAPDLELGHAPVPGATRVLRAEELQGLAKRRGLEIVPRSEPVCFEWRMSVLDEADVIQAMRRSLPDDARVTLQEFSRAAAPPGTIVFPIETLKAGLWRGYVSYGDSKRFDIWARVRVEIKQTRVVAAAPLKPGSPLTAVELRLEEFEAEPDASSVRTIEEAVGRVVKGPVAEGSALLVRMLDLPAAVTRGATVSLRAAVGSAQVMVEGQAQASGRIGEIIPVKNVTSGRVVRARIDGVGEVTWTP